MPVSDSLVSHVQYEQGQRDCCHMATLDTYVVLTRCICDICVMMSGATFSGAIY